MSRGRRGRKRRPPRRPPSPAEIFDRYSIQTPHEKRKQQVLAAIGIFRSIFRVHPDQEENARSGPELARSLANLATRQVTEEEIQTLGRKINGIINRVETLARQR